MRKKPQARYTIVPSPTNMFELVAKKCQVPDQWKIARICATYKKRETNKKKTSKGPCPC